MSTVQPNQGAVYSPLPFSDSDSSEEEVFNKNAIQLTEIRNVTNRKIVLSEKTAPSKNGKAMQTAESSMMAEYRPLSNSETSLNGFGERGRLVLLPNSPTTVEEAKPDNIKEIKQSGWAAMSRMRKTCFISSLLLCIFTIVGFLWILPCDLESTCDRTTDTGSEHALLGASGSWETILRGIEVTGPPSIAQGHIVFTVRGPQPSLRSFQYGEPRWKSLGYGPFLPDGESKGHAGGGAVALWPGTGEIAWAVNTPGAAPVSALCDLLDATGDGRYDCLVANPDWLLAALDPAAGVMIWYLHVHRDNSTQQSRNSSRKPMESPQRKPARIRFPPIKIRDVDGDGISDLCALCSPQLSSSLDNFVLVSGKRGNVIGQLVNVSGCVSLTALEIEESDSTLSFTCINQAGAESVRIMPVEELYLRAINRSLQDPEMLPPLQKRQQPPRDAYEQSSNDGKGYIVQVRGHRLSVENKGTCPRCRSLVILSDMRNNTLWSYQGRGEKAMAPVQLHFSGNNAVVDRIAPLKPNPLASMSGFVLKFWQWPPPFPRQSGTKRPEVKPFHKLLKRAVIRDNKANRGPVEHIGVEEGSGPSQPSIQVIQLKERVLLITFNDTDLHVINASQSSVVQLCTLPQRPVPLQRYTTKEPICQPDLLAQQNSLLIADLDDDGTQELISYLSTYSAVKEPDAEGVVTPPSRAPPTSSVPISWELVSRVKVIHLENELSKLA